MEPSNLYHSESVSRKDKEFNSASLNIILYDLDMYFLYSFLKQSAPGLAFVLFDRLCFTHACRSSA